MHEYNINNGHLPSATPDPRFQPPTKLSWRVQLLPFLEQDGLYQASGGDSGNVAATVRKVFLCPADISTWPTGPALDAHTNPSYASCNYAGNVWAFTPKYEWTIESAMPNGTSNTITWVERYRNCGDVTDGPAWGWYELLNGPPSVDTPMFGCPTANAAEFITNPSNPGGYGDCPDYNQGPVTFQVQPRLGPNPGPNFDNSLCVYRATQTAHNAGMQVGLGDGSVRTVAGTMSASTWFAACYVRQFPGYPVLFLGSDW